MSTEPLHHIDSISAYHQFAGLPKPGHPLISVVRFDDIRPKRIDRPKSFVNNFYSIALKRNFNGRMKYGQQPYDFDDGVMVFLAPGQVLAVAADETLEHSGWLLMIHPDFLWHTPLAKTIRQYDYFDYSIREALFLSEKEEAVIVGIIQQIQQEYQLQSTNSAKTSSLLSSTCCSSMPTGFTSDSSLPGKLLTTKFWTGLRPYLRIILPAMSD